MNFSEKLFLSHQDVCENKVITNTLYDLILGGWITIDDYEFMKVDVRPLVKATRKHHHNLDKQGRKWSGCTW